MKLPLLSLALAPLVASHFTLKYPASRGEDEEKMSQGPCGGLSLSSKRTQISLDDGSFPLALEMGHAETALDVLLALGDDPGSNFNITLKSLFRVEGLGAFCVPSISFDESVVGVKLADGMNATVQVQSNGDPSGGLYACADIQFSSKTTGDQPSSCKNNTGVTATPFTGSAAKLNANESTAEGQPQSGSDGHSHSHGGDSSTTGPAATSTGGAVPLETAAWGMLGAAVVGGLAIL
ncbi:hypothetical protein FE257_001736 [Aspergillus nanangensis]|uniref:Copper acquisition factor BIM1-like domain-containing protein n=1 Tax=Aspergillus nanangensis TaxID=2582783 RepID=A0AAD4CDH9_ASPNN|nr:hypothetical protein FE257_001736 [Aspergillus nanangensis]